MEDLIKVLLSIIVLIFIFLIADIETIKKNWINIVLIIGGIILSIKKLSN